MWFPTPWFLQVANGDRFRAHLYSRAAFALAVLLAMVLASPGLLTLRDRFGSFCLFQGFLGIPCPGCGITRSLALLAQFRFDAALAANPAGYFVALTLCVPVPLLLGRTPRTIASRVLSATDALLLLALVVSWCITLVLHPLG